MSMEDEVESAWLGLKIIPVAVFVSSTGRVGTLSHVQNCKLSDLVGYYDCRVTLIEFRDDVYSVFCKLMRG